MTWANHSPYEKEQRRGDAVVVGKVVGALGSDHEPIEPTAECSRFGDTLGLAIESLTASETAT